MNLTIKEISKMNLKANGFGFQIKDRQYCIGEVIRYKNPKIKGLILFGFYDNGLEYND